MMPKLKKISTQTSQFDEKFDAQRSIRELEARVGKLEQLLEYFSGVQGIDSEIPTVKTRRPGPKPAHVWSMRSGRDQFVRMLEDYWPEIEPYCIPRPNSDGLKGTLSAIAKVLAGRHELPAKHLIRHLPEFVKFLSGDRFRSDPRQIANALSGFPQVSIWRSLKVCQATQ